MVHMDVTVNHKRNMTLKSAAAKITHIKRTFDYIF